ncbi:MAG: BTB/POZ domain-containing protein [Parachlamydiaceae bacterium]|nr:BTB/POZ domain-containing protein [Parachlamydiaceae bacterium]
MWKEKKIQDIYFKIQEARCEAIRAGKSEFEITINFEIDCSYFNTANFFKNSFGVQWEQKASWIRVYEFTSKDSNRFLNLCEEDFKNINAPSKIKFTSKNEIELLFSKALMESKEKISDERFYTTVSQVAEVVEKLKLANSKVGIDGAKIKKENIIIAGESQFQGTMIPFFTRVLDIIPKLITDSKEASQYTLKGRVDAKEFEGSYQKPIFLKPKAVQLDYDPTKFSDVSFLIDGKEFKMHRVMLLNVPFFADAMDSLEGCSSGEPQPLNMVTARAFEELRNYLYNKPICQNNNLSDFTFCLELYQLSDCMDVPFLKSVAVNGIADLIDSKNFMSIAMAAQELGSPELNDLCNWFSMENGITEDDQFDISNYSVIKLLHLKELSHKFNLVKIEQSIDIECANKIDLSDDFTSICKFIKERKDKKMFKSFTKTLESKGLVDKLLDDRDKFKDQYKAYKEMNLRAPSYK